MPQSSGAEKERVKGVSRISLRGQGKTQIIDMGKGKHTGREYEQAIIDLLTRPGKDARREDVNLPNENFIGKVKKRIKGLNSK